MFYYIKLVLIIGLASVWFGKTPLAAQDAPNAAREADVARNQSLLGSAWGATVGTGDSSGADAPPAAPKMAGDDEYGEQRILVRRASWSPWNVEFDAQVLWTDNVALAHDNSQSDSYLRTGLKVGYSNRVVGNLFFNASWDYHTIRHSEAVDLDFDMGRGDLGIMYMLPKLQNAFIVARYTYYKLTEVGLGSKLYEDHVASLGLQKIWKISRGQQIFAGIYGDWSIAPEPWEAGRHEYSAALGWKLRLTDKLTVQTTYRGAYYYYRTGQRTDWNHVALVGAAYAITDWLSVNLMGSYSINRSSATVFDYGNFILGAGVSTHWEF